MQRIENVATKLPQSDDLNRLCHNNRNFLLAIAANAALLPSSDDETRRILIADIQHAVSCMLEIADDTLARSRAVHDTATTKTAFDIQARIVSIARIFAPAARAKRIDIVVELGELPPLTVGAPLLVTETLSNFLSNALKYAPEDSNVVLTAARQGECIRLEVKDCGPGISNELRGRLFQPFSQGVDAKPGSGLGLSLCKQMVEEAGGAIGVESEPGMGATFYFTLPHVAPPEAALPESWELISAAAIHGEQVKSAAAAVAAAATVDRPQVLVVDDNPDVARMAVHMFASFGWVATVVESCSGALDHLGQEKFALCFVDEGLIDGSGLDLVRAIRLAKIGGEKLRIIGTSGSILDGQFEAAGADGFQCKPYLPSQLRALIERVMA